MKSTNERKTRFKPNAVLFKSAKKFGSDKEFRAALDAGLPIRGGVRSFDLPADQSLAVVVVVEIRATNYWDAAKGVFVTHAPYRRHYFRGVATLAVFDPPCTCCSWARNGVFRIQSHTG
jgi:hypothetical protein